MKEYIICSAIHFDDGKEHVHQPKNIKTGFVISGRRHHNCYATLAAIGKAVGLENAVKDIDIQVGRNGQGFITNLDRFVNRKEGMKIAKEAGQLINPKLHEGNQDAILTSEDLYSEDLY